MSSSNCCFLTCIQISREGDKVVWDSHLLKNFPQFVVIHTVKGFGVVNKAEVDVVPELTFFFEIQWILAIWSLVPLPFLNPDWIFGSSWYTSYWSLLKNVEHYFASMWDEYNCAHFICQQGNAQNPSGFNSTWTENFQMNKLDLEKAKEPEIKLPTSFFNDTATTEIYTLSLHDALPI